MEIMKLLRVKTTRLVQGEKLCKKNSENMKQNTSLFFFGFTNIDDAGEQTPQ
jgi:hypothetical protein